MKTEKKLKVLNELYNILNNYMPRHWIVRAEEWNHPRNTVPNCLAMTLDGIPYWKFRMVKDTLQFAETRATENFPIQIGSFVSVKQIDRAVKIYATPINERMSPRVRGNT